MNTHGHYDVRRGGPDGYIQRLVCMHCNFFVARGEVSGAPAPNWDHPLRHATVQPDARQDSQAPA